MLKSGSASEGRSMPHYAAAQKCKNGVRVRFILLTLPTDILMPNIHSYSREKK